MPETPAPIAPTDLDDLKAHAEKAFVVATRATSDLLVDHARIFVSDLGQLGKAAAQLGAETLQLMAAIAKRFAAGEIDAPSADIAMRQLEGALRDIADGGANTAAVVARKRAIATFNGMKAILLGLVSAGATLIGPAASIGINTLLSRIDDLGGSLRK